MEYGYKINNKYIDVYKKYNNFIKIIYNFIKIYLFVDYIC